MSGHSKWNNIKRKKEKADGAKAKVFTKIGRELAVAVKEGGSADPAANSRLRDCIAKAKAANVPNVVDDVDIAIINGNYAIAAGFKVNTDALAVESADSEAAKTYANLLVVKDGNQDSDKIKALAEALNSDEVRDYINNTYEGAVVPVF